MKTAKCLFAFAAAFALSFSAFAEGHTGSEAAEGISSNPSTKGKEKRDTYEIQMQYYDKAQKALAFADVALNDNSTFDDLNNVINALQHNVSSVAYNSLLALAKVAFLEGETQWLGLRIDTLTQTTQDAFRALDRIDLVDEVSGIKKSLSKKDKADSGNSGNTYFGPNIFNVAAAQADGKSIVSNSQDKLALYGLPQSQEAYGKMPFWAGSNLGWFFLKDLFDGVSVEAATDGGGSGIRNYGIGIAGWKTQSPCQENLSKMLTDKEDSANRNAHKLLCRVNTGESAVIHYLPIGEVIEIPDASVPLDDASIASNSVGKVEIKGFSAASGVTYAIPVKIGNEVRWKPLYEADVIVRSEYNTSTHQLVNYKKKIFIIPPGTSLSEPSESQVTTPVFAATACPAEP